MNAFAFARSRIFRIVGANSGVVWIKICVCSVPSSEFSHSMYCACGCLDLNGWYNVTRRVEEGGCVGNGFCGAREGEAGKRRK